VAVVEIFTKKSCSTQFFIPLIVFSNAPETPLNPSWVFASAPSKEI